VRIAFNARILSDPVLRGWNRYTLNLVSGLVALGADVYLYSDRPCDPAQLAQLPVSSVTMRQAPAMNYLTWEHQWIPRQCAMDRIDVFHSPIHFGLPQFVKAKCVLTLHDAIDEIYYAPKLRKKTISQRLTSALCWLARHRADHIVTVSEHSRRDLIRHFKLRQDRISVTYEAADKRFHNTVTPEERRRVRAKYKLPSKFLFYVGSLEPRKNIPFLLKALAMTKISDLHAVIGGGKEDEQSALSKLAANLGIPGQAMMIGRVEDDDLPALYAEAQAFVYPSEYEGFGLQICEALAVGCPVFAAHASCLPEILAYGGETFPLSDPSRLAELLTQMHLHPLYRVHLQKRARERSQFFSWAQTAKSTLAIYEGLCADQAETYVNARPAVSQP
jgi:glycosyltransferase involved in cell wall biosynthesis